MLGANFDMKDLGEANVVLVRHQNYISKNGISLYQILLHRKVLKKYNYFESKPTCTPYDSSVKLFKNTGDNDNQSKYTSIIGSLRYVLDCTRPDRAYIVGLLCRFTSRPSLEHWNASNEIS